MSLPDYEQFSEDHQSLLILIKSIGPQMDSSLFNFIYNRLIQYYEIKITDNKLSGFDRTIHLRYKQSYSIENNDWGDFQAHRRLVGLISIGQSFKDNEIESLSELHKTIRDTYANTLFDSRCFIIRHPTSDAIAESEQTLHVEKNEGFKENKKEISNEENELVADSFNNFSSNLINDVQLFEFPLGDQLFISSNHNSFTSHVNRSSSSSSLSTINSPTSSNSKLNLVNENKSQPDYDELNHNSLPSIPVFDSSEATPSEIRSRTHSRNKSLDSRLLLSPNHTGQDKSLNANSSTIGTRAHSSSSLLSINNSRDTLHSTTNEYIQYDSDEQCCEQIELRIKDFITGLFWVLESKRLDRAREKMEKIPLLMAPFEKKDMIGLDTDTRSFRRKCMGRMRKHIADLSLLAGLPQESLFNYISAIEQLKAVNDKLWLASAYEGLCSASLVLFYPNRWRLIQQRRIHFKIQNRGDIIQQMISCNDYEFSRTEIRNIFNQMSKEEHETNEKQLESNKNLMKIILNTEQFYERYKDAISYYSLYRTASVLQFECNMKAAHTMIFLGRYLKASVFIHDAVYVNFNQTVEEKVERLLIISQLYEQIGFYRKAAFYKRFAALKTASFHIKNPDWQKCYFLLLPALFGYGLNLNPTEYDQLVEKNQMSWSGIHVQLMQDLINVSLKMQNETLAMRHLSFMLQCLFTHISPTQRQELAANLSSLASKCGEGSPVPLKLQNGAIIPSVNFTKFPTVIYFKVEPLKPYLRPHKLKLSTKEESLKQPKNSGPFIYTPLQLNWTPPSNKNVNKNDSVTKVSFYWVEGNTGRITISFYNYLPIELSISSIVVMTDGVVFEPKHDTSLKIGANSTNNNISLTGIPRSTGTLDILGYKIHALGIKSDCKLNQLPNSKKLKLPSRFTVEVIPRLPLMCAQCLTEELTDHHKSQYNLLPVEDCFPEMHISNSNFISIYSGEQKAFVIHLFNISQHVDELIELVNIEVVFAKNLNSELRELIDFEWKSDELNNALPIGRDQSTSFEIKLNIKGKFVLQSKQLFNNDCIEKSKLTVNGLPNTQNKKSQVLGSTKLANLLNEFQSRKLSNENSSNNNKTIDLMENEFSDEIFESKLIDVCIRFEYSGGPGLNSGFCRQTSIHFVIEIKPSILITHWDVISAEQQDECYLVLDTLNATEHELNLFYTSNKEMLIEPREKCRIPVPIKRYPIRLLNLDNELHNDSNRKQNSNSPDEKIVDFLSYIFPKQQQLKLALAQCKKYLLKQIDLKWKLTNNDTEGVTLVHEVPFSNSILKSLLIPPIKSEIRLDTSIFHSSYGEFNFKLGEHIPIEMHLLNTSDTVLQYFRLNLFCFQDYQTSQHPSYINYNLETKLIINGNTTTCIKKLQPDESFTHKCGIIFLYPGLYKLQISFLPEEWCKVICQNLTSQYSYSQNCCSFEYLHTIEITVEE